MRLPQIATLALLLPGCLIMPPGIGGLDKPTVKVVGVRVTDGVPGIVAMAPNNKWNATVQVDATIENPNGVEIRGVGEIASLTDASESVQLYASPGSMFQVPARATQDGSLSFVATFKAPPDQAGCSPCKLKGRLVFFAGTKQVRTDVEYEWRAPSTAPQGASQASR
jgi:hypothetical protein